MIETRLIDNRHKTPLERRYIDTLLKAFLKVAEQIYTDIENCYTQVQDILERLLCDYVHETTDLVEVIIEEFVDQIKFEVKRYKLAYFKVPPLVWKIDNIIQIHDRKYHRVIVDDQ